MSDENLGPGEYYGDRKRTVASQDFIVSHLKHNRERQLPRHAHALAFVCVLIDGQYRETDGASEIVYDPFTAVFHTAGSVHADQIGAGGARFLSLEFGQRWLDLLRSETSAPTEKLAARRGDSLVWQTCLLAHHSALGGPRSALTVDCLAMELLHQTVPRVSRLDSVPPGWLARVEDRLRNDFSNGLRLEELARDAGVHPVHLSRTFRRFHGITPGEFVHRQQVKFAARKIANRHVSLAEVAVDAGFADQSHFTRVFKSVTGFSPGAFRRTMS